MTRPPPSVRAAAWILTRSHAPGRLMRWAQRRLLARTPSLLGMSSGELADILKAEDPAQRACLLGWVPEGMNARQVLAAVDRLGLVGPAAVLLADLALPTGALSLALYEAIALDAAGDPDRTRSALLAVRRAPERMLAPQRAPIFARVWRLAEQPVDPYAPSALHDAARSAAAVLLAEHVDLRPGALEALAAPNARQLRLVYAAGLQGARGSLGDAVGEVLAATRPAEQAAIGFARDCDRDFSAADPVLVRGSSRWRARASRLLERRHSVRVWRWLAPAVCLVGVPAAGAGLALAANALRAFDYKVTLSTGTVVAVAGVLVAIHVVASELAADRLPGLVARATSVPLPLWAGYGSVAALYGLAVWQPSGHAVQTRSVITVGVIAALALSLVLSLWKLLSRTDNVVAARIFASGEVRRAVRSGRAVGRMHSSVLTARSDTAALLWVRPTISAPLSVRRAPIETGREGYLVMRGRVLRKLNRDGWWRDGARLWLSRVLGTLVHQGDEVASIVLPADETLSERTRRDAHRLFAVRRLAGAERTGEAIGALVELTSRLAEAGNEAGASRVARRAVEVLHAHVGALERARGPLPTGEVGAPVGAARAAALAVSRALQRGEHPATREVMTGLVQRALPGCTRGDSFLATLIEQLASFGSPDGDPDLAQRLLWDCGRRTVQLEDRVIARLWWEAVVRLARDEERRDSVIEMAGRVVQYASLIDSADAERAWGRLRGFLRPEQTRDQLIAVRIGASALLVGQVSLAVLVARFLAPAAWSSLATIYEQPTMLDWESASDQLYGHLLGAAPDLTLGEFVRLGKAVAQYAT